MNQQSKDKTVAGDSAQSGSAAAARAKDPVRRWTIIVLVVSVALVLWYLRADRVTPMTTQARVHARVVPVAPEVSGTISSVSVDNNQVVEADQPLFSIDGERYKLAVQRAEASLDQAYQALGASEANVKAAQAALDSAIAGMERAQLDAKRIRRIREQDPGAISERRLESAEATYAQAKSNVEASRANLQAAIEQRGKTGADNAAVLQALSGLEAARIDLERSVVRAPGNGVVTGVQLDQGSFAAAGHPQLTFIATDEIWVQADFRENNLGHIDPGDEVAMVFDALPGQVIEGTVSEIGFGVDVGDPPLGKLPTIRNDKAWLRSAQRYPVLINFEVPTNDQAQTRVKVGSQVKVVVYTGPHPAFNMLGRMLMRLRALLEYAY